MRFIYLILVVLLCYQCYVARHGRNCYDQYIHITKELATAQEDTYKIEQRLEMVEKDIVSLEDQKDFTVVEDLARSNLGMIKPGEVFYRVYDNEENK